MQATSEVLQGCSLLLHALLLQLGLNYHGFTKEQVHAMDVYMMTAISCVSGYATAAAGLEPFRL